MAKIKDLLRIQSSYYTQVNLKKEFNDRVLKEERMSNYKPIKAHRKAFETIAEGAYVKNSKRCFILSGSYGTGKSHLLLMASNYFENQSDTKEMSEFFKNYTESEENDDNKQAERLKKVRKEGRYLVCICDYGKNNFEGFVLRSIKEALEKEGIAEHEMDSYYLQAINKINEWKNSEDSYFYDRLEKSLENKNDAWTVNKLVHELSQYNKESIEIFKEIHKKITTTEFEYDKDNYVQIIEQLSKSKVIRGKSKVIRGKFAGILILFDEFDYQLQGKRFDLDEFQKFGEMCAASFMNNFPVIFVATTHRSFASYRSAYNTEDFLTVNDRIREISLETQGIEDIIAAVVNPQKNSKLWESFVEPRVSIFNQLSNECNSLKIFDWLSPSKIRSKIVENIYPMHPMATYSLLKLASDVGSNNRSVFTFFADEKKDIGSYDYFVSNNDILNSMEELQLYTVEMLFEYFKDKINSDNQELRQTVKEYVRNYETSLRELSKIRSTSLNLDIQDEIYTSILKTMIIYQIIGVDINLRTLKFGLNMNTQVKEKELEYSLKNACSKKLYILMILTIAMNLEGMML